MDQKLLNEKKRSNLYLRGEDDADSDVSRGVFKGKRLRYRQWYICYVITAVLVLLCTLILLAFGVGASGEDLVSLPRLDSAADKVINSIVDMFFLDLHEEDRAPNTDHIPEIDNGFLLPEDNGADSSGEQDDHFGGDGDNQSSDFYNFDYSLVPEDGIPIIPMDLSLLAYGEGYINNSTAYAPTIDALLNRDLPINDFAVNSSLDDPKILIIHTHGTEAYSPDGAIFCESLDDHGRDSDRESNVVAVGKIIADILNRNEIRTIHCTVMHDSTQYKDSYSRAAETIRKYLEEYPSIELVIDVHRDAIIKSNGEIVKPIAQVDGRASAQIMCVVGSDFGGGEYQNWEDNLSLALQLRRELNDEYGNICRPVTLKSSTYNQEFSKYSLLLEMGSSGNSLEEAKLAAELVANALVDLIK